MSHLKKFYWILFTIILCFSLGYWVGLNPGLYDQYLDLTKAEIQLYCQNDQVFFPANFLKEIQDLLPVKIKLTTEHPELADVLFVDNTYLKSLAPAVLKENTTWATTFKNISADFQLQFFKTTQTIPIFWKIENKHLQTMSFVVHMKKYKNQSLQYRLINLLISKNIMLRWMKFVNWNSTLNQIKETDIDEKRTSQEIRKIELKNLDTQ